MFKFKYPYLASGHELLLTRILALQLKIQILSQVIRV